MKLTRQSRFPLLETFKLEDVSSADNDMQIRQGGIPHLHQITGECTQDRKGDYG